MDEGPEPDRSLYFNAYDDRNGIAVLMRIGRRPACGEKSMFFFIMGRQLAAGTRASGPDSGAEPSCAGLEFEDLGCGRWRLRYSGPAFDPHSEPPASRQVEADLTWSAVSPEFDYGLCVPALSGAGPRHSEQLGSVFGTISVGGGPEVDFMGYGARDRTSGGLAWGTSDAVQWAASVYGGRAGFGLSRISAGGAESDAGYVFIDGADVPVVSAEEEVRRRRDGSPSGFTLSLRDASGAVHLVEGEVVCSEMLPFPGRGDAALVEAVAETRWNGRRGFGIAEFAVRR